MTILRACFLGAVVLGGLLWGAVNLGCYMATTPIYRDRAAEAADMHRAFEKIIWLEDQLVVTRRALADKERRLEGCRKTIRRYSEELADVDAKLAEAKGEK